MHLTQLLAAWPETAAMDAVAAAAFLNALTAPVPVPAGDVIRYLTLVGKWEAIKIASEGDTGAAKTVAARKMTSALADFESFDLANAQYLAVVTARLDDLVAHGLIGTGAPGDREIILALGANRRSRAGAAGLGEISPGDIKTARGF
ncbi:MAG: hypothetical protein ABL951_06965 [Alphaproteobacteria bacterium]